MTALVLPFAPVKKPVSKDAPHYFCQRCEGDRFKAFESGDLHCISCGSRMSNLIVGTRPVSA